MGKVMINAGGGGGGASSDETNVVASQVLSGKTYLGADTNGLYRSDITGGDRSVYRHGFGKADVVGEER